MSETAGEPAAVPPPTPGRAAPDAAALVRAVREAWDKEFYGTPETYIDVRQAQTAVDTVLAAIAAAPACPCGGLLKRAADALWACAKAALTVEPTLKQPYPDDPRWSPWTRWVERPAREAHDTAMAIRKHLRETGGQP